MNKLFSTVLICIALLLLSACSTINNTATFTPAPATGDPDHATVYIYRPSAMSNALYSPGLNVDGEFRLYTRNGVNSLISLPAGEHVFEFQAEKKYSELTPITLSLDAGLIYFIRVTTTLKINDTVGYEPYVRSFKLTRVNEQQAVKEIAECCLDDGSETLDKSETKPADEETGSGFTVDKTQNPFSH